REKRRKRRKRRRKKKKRKARNNTLPLKIPQLYLSLDLNYLCIYFPKPRHLVTLSKVTTLFCHSSPVSKPVLNLIVVDSTHRVNGNPGT
ncbi:MAG: hypothetical protein AABY44_03865, partial [Nitrospirota bacterium]